jgi:hypothetical protein
MQWIKQLQWQHLATLILVIALYIYVSNRDVEANSQFVADGTFYVSRNGDNSDGLSWQTAWNELNQINWEQVEAGDMIYVDSGDSEMLYETSLEIGKSGAPDMPITIQAASQSGTSGQVILFGGREALLPYCGQEDYDNQEEGLREYGIRTNDHDYIMIDGMDWSGISIHGYLEAGIYVDSESTHITIRNVEVYNNGEARETDEGWRSDHAGIRLGGSDVTFQRIIVHDNGQDAIQSLHGDNHIANFRLEQSWLYNEREHPTAGESANYCTHTDGIQIYDGGVVSGITITDSIIGPGFTQNLMMGQSRNDNGSWASVQDVVLRDVLLARAEDNNVMSYRDTDPEQWYLDHVTIHCPDTKSHCLKILNESHTIINSVVVDGLITLEDDLSLRNNCYWNTRGTRIGEETELEFADVENMDYTLVTGSNCAGTRVTSIEQLFNMEEESTNDD